MVGIESELIAILTDLFRGFLGKVKFYRLKWNLKKKLFYRVLNVYGDRPYYNDLDSFLSVNKVLQNIIANIESMPIHQYKSRSQIVHYYVQLFVERYPNYISYKSDIYSLIQSCFEVIYSTLNNSSDEKIRVIGSIAKELAGEISNEIQVIKTDVLAINDKIDILLNQMNNEFRNNDIQFEQYFEYLFHLYNSTINNDSLFPRSLYKDGEDNDIDSLDALLRDKHILLLGEAGYGKTYESLRLINKICIISKSKDLLPFYLPLSEYGILYSSIMEGIQYKLSPYCENVSKKLIQQWLISGQAVLVLDGIDEIQMKESRSKFVADVKNIALQYNKCYLFITSRINRYHGELGNISIYKLRALSRDVIRKQLNNENIHIDLPDSYFQLFENPLFFDVGRKILKRNKACKIFNRSILFEELMIMLCGEWDKRKGISTAQRLSYTDIIGILGRYAYETFYQPSSSILEFDRYISKSISSDNKPLIIDILLASGVLKVTDRIEFVHKLFKEYCTAFHLVNTYPLSENRSLYLDLVNRDNWKEVFIFASGMYNLIDKQDEFLDFIMDNNLKLYIECINAKSDLSAQLPPPNTQEFARRYLCQIIRTYTFIVDKYFYHIRFLFEPFQDQHKTEEVIHNNKMRIVGCISYNGENLIYWLEWVTHGEEDVVIIDENNIVDYRKNNELQAIAKGKNIVYHSVNLKNAGLVGDSGRKIAIDLIKYRINYLLEHKMLIESKYLLCERLDNYRKRIEPIKDITSIDQMYTIIDDMIQKVKDHRNNPIRYLYNGVDMFYLRSLLKDIINNNIEFDKCLLPKEDTRPKGSRGWIWNFYSDTQKVNRISMFLYFHQLSYIEMAETNFPLLCHMFTRYLDSPYQEVVYIDLKKSVAQNDIFSEPYFTHYYIASETDYPSLPQLRYIDSMDELNDHDIFNEIKQSYLIKGKEAHNVQYTQRGFAFTVISPKDNTPLSDFVYASIKESLEEIFGKLYL